MPDYPRIPYGWADFRAIRLEGRLYVDKTRFLRRLEEERYVFLIRPRRFGKSCWVSVLENYYERTRAGEFEGLFGGTDVGRRPTDDRHRYVVLRFDFSVFDDAPETLRERFQTYCDTVLYYALERNRDLFPEAVRQRILSPPGVVPGVHARGRLLSELFRHSRAGPGRGAAWSACSSPASRPSRSISVVRLCPRAGHPAVRAHRRVRQLRQHHPASCAICSWSAGAHFRHRRGASPIQPTDHFVFRSEASSARLLLRTSAWSRSSPGIPTCVTVS